MWLCIYVASVSPLVASLTSEAERKAEKDGEVWRQCQEVLLSVPCAILGFKLCLLCAGFSISEAEWYRAPKRL
jgi:hypothetical protein